VADAATTRRRLIAELRTLRTDAGLNQRQVADTLDWSPSKIHRIEKGDVSVSVTDLRALLALYGMGDGRAKDELVQLAKDARRQPLPFSAYRDVLPPDVMRYFAYEQAASSLAELALLAFPGLLQTEAYARALLSGVHGFEESRVQRLVESRAERQRLLSAGRAPRFTFFIDESVLLRAIGGPEVMREQLEHLCRVGEMPNVAVRVLPLSLGAHVGLRGPFALLTFRGQNDPDVLFVENRRGDALFRGEPEVTDAYRQHVEELRALAAPAGELPRYVERAMPD
jgi:transcriptional regulator with XRE-family HTH domain